MCVIYTTYVKVSEEDRRGCWVPLELELYAVVRGSTSGVKTEFRSIDFSVPHASSQITT